MGYIYENERQEIFTESGMAMFVEMRDQVKAKCKIAGAVRFDALSFTGSSWTALACMDLMIERNDIRRVTEGQGIAAQHHVYTWKE